MSARCAHRREWAAVVGYALANAAILGAGIHYAPEPEVWTRIVWGHPVGDWTVAGSVAVFALFAWIAGRGAR